MVGLAHHLSGVSSKAAPGIGPGFPACSWSFATVARRPRTLLLLPHRASDGAGVPGSGGSASAFVSAVEPRIKRLPLLVCDLRLSSLRPPPARTRCVQQPGNEGRRVAVHFPGWKSGSVYGRSLTCTHPTSPPVYGRSLTCTHAASQPRPNGRAVERGPERKVLGRRCVVGRDPSGGTSAPGGPCCARLDSFPIARNFGGGLASFSGAMPPTARPGNLRVPRSCGAAPPATARGVHAVADSRGRSRFSH